MKTGTKIALIVGGVVLIGGAVAGVIYWRKRNAQKPPISIQNKSTNKVDMANRQDALEIIELANIMDNGAMPKNYIEPFISLYTTNLSKSEHMKLVSAFNKAVSDKSERNWNNDDKQIMEVYGKRVINPLKQRMR